MEVEWDQGGIGRSGRTRGVRGGSRRNAGGFGEAFSFWRGVIGVDLRVAFLERTIPGEVAIRVDSMPATSMLRAANIFCSLLPFLVWDAFLACRKFVH